MEENAVYIQVKSSLELYRSQGKVSLSLESIIIYSVYKYCAPDQITLYFVFSDESFGQTNGLWVVLDDQTVNVKQFDEIPWQAASCAFPVVKYGDMITTGMCAVARHICKQRTTSPSEEEHEEGLLGFRHSCLQAPNEASVWTKFCEIDLVKATMEILKGNHDNEFPVNIARFENHLKKPVKVHNVYKIARNAASKKPASLNDIVVKNENFEHVDSGRVPENVEKYHSRVSKNRKWKSSSSEYQNIPSSTPIDQLNIAHKFAEGPFITLADLVLYPCYAIIIQYYSNELFSSAMPLTSHWAEALQKIEGLLPIKKIFKSILKLNQISPAVSSSMLTPPVLDFSLYKSDPKRHNPKKRLFTKEVDIEGALSILGKGMELSLQNNDEMQQIDWKTIPSGANPKAGHLPDKRMDRKSQQLENLTLAVLKVAKKGDLIVDFCSGSGHLGILIAHLLPHCTVILLENKEQSLLRARTRVHEMGLKNVYFFQCNLDFFIGTFDIGIALHACGIASDLVLDKCLKANAKFIICPCCYGALHTTDRLQYPRSLSFSSMPTEQYICIGHAADQTHSDHPLAVRGARCMAVIDSDRARLAEEFGYKVTLSRLKPLSCTPKNNLLIGVPS